MIGYFNMSGHKRRKQRTREPRKVYVIVCEGKETERIYFKRYRTRYSNLKIEPLNSKFTDPINLARFAKERINKEGLDLRNGDIIWCVFDCDENTNDAISQACKIAGKDVKICLSNPNFELWFLLHFSPIASKLDRFEVVNKLKEYIPKYDKTLDVYDLLLNNRSIAIDNAKKLNKLHEKDEIKLISVESNPSTQVYRVVEEILKITDSPN